MKKKEMPAEAEILETKAEATETTETATETAAEAAETETEEEIQIQSESESETETEEPKELFPIEETKEKTEEPIKGKRGRKAGGKNKPKETEEIKEEKTEEQKTEDEIKNEIFGKKKEEKKEENKPQAEAPKQLFSISGEMLLGAIDFTFPLIITQAGGFFDKDVKQIKVESLQLDETEKKALMPAAEIVAKENIKLTAMEMLFSGLLIIYTGKIYQAVKEIKQNK